LRAGSENQPGLTFSLDGKSAFWVEWGGECGSSDSDQRIIYTSSRESAT
jgi:hypothetical protein